MIAASEPQEFVPFGRQQIKKHPGNVVLPTNTQQLPYDSFLAQRFSQVYICDGDEKEWWTMRLKDGVEEELYICGNTAIVSRGTIGRGVAFGRHHKGSTRVVEACYTMETPIKQALWTNFIYMKDRTYCPLPSLCVVDTTKISVFTEDGQDFITPLQFKVSSVWATKFGLLLERVAHNHGLSPENCSNLTTLFSLLHPLDEIAPLLTVKQGGILTYMNDPTLKVVYTSENPSICLLYSTRTGEHSIWKLRQTLSEECQWMCGNDTGLTLHDSAANTNYSSSNLSSGSAQFSFKTATNRSGTASPLLGRTNGGSIHSSVLSTNYRGSSPLLWKQGLECSNASSVEARLGCSLVPSLDVEPKPIIPELCLEYLWTDSISPSQRRDSERDGAAKKAFLTRDILDQEYLAYLTGHSLVLVRLGVTNTDESLVGTVTRIQARDAASIESSKMLAVLEPNSGSVMLYTGTLAVGKLHIAGVSAELASSSYLSSVSAAPTVNSPFPKRSSLLSSTKLGDALFDDTAVHLLSPVTQVFSDTHSPTRDQVRGLRDSLGARFTLEFSNGVMFRFTLPEFGSSPLVKRCVEVLKCILQKDCALLTLIKWYTIRNAPGTQDISPKHEWRLFTSAILSLLGYQPDSIPMNDFSFASDCETPAKNTKKMRASDLGSNYDWNYLVKSSYHKCVSSSLSQILRLDPLPVASSSSSDDEKIFLSETFSVSAPLFPYIHLILFSFHLLYEELKLSPALSDLLSLLVQLLHQLATDLQLTHYCHYYWRDFPTTCLLPTNQESRMPMEQERMSLPSFMNVEPPCLFQQIFNVRQRLKYDPYPVMTGVNPKSRNILEILSVISGVGKPCMKTVVPPGSRCSTPQPVPLQVPQDLPNHHRAVLLMDKLGMKREEINSYPSGINLMLTKAIQSAAENPPPGWQPSVYTFIGRLDLCNSPKLPNVQSPVEETLSQQVLKLRFNKDQRMEEVKKLLDSSEPVTIAITQRPEVSDHEFIEEQERHLYSICTRTMALPVGRGMLNLHTTMPLTSEPLDIPRLCLSGRAPPRGTTVELSHIEVVPNMNLWPLFHNGVAAGLEISPNTKSIDSTWIIYNKPKNGSDLLPEHAGFLMALGLSGLLDNLSELNLYNYLNKCHEMTSVGLLLGLAASKRGTMDFRATKLFSVHIESLLPPTSIELDLVQNIQVAALLGIGLIYQGTAHRHITEVLLAEIGRPPGPEMENSSDRECYSLAAGLGLGLVVLGRGGNLTDPSIADTLQYYMVGGTKRPLTGSQKDKYKSPSYQIREGDTVNNHVTGPGATLALGMMFFDTGNMAVAKWLDPPDSEYLLDFICPDMLLLRALARGLILWSQILPSKAWVESHVPARILPYCLVKPKEGMDGVDLETMNQAYCNIIAGACMALGLRFAGSANNEAYVTLMHYVKLFVTVSTKSLAELPGRPTIESCICVCLLSLSMVMAGTGDLGVLRLCRHLGGRTGSNPAVTYGSHLAVHMSLGLLFLGGGLATLSTTPEAVAAMLCAFFPRFPTHSNDNRYHLQAFRHLYVLAIERRVLLPRDIDTGKLCFAHLTVLYLDTSYYRDQQVKLFAPCIIPELYLLKEVRVEDDRYWPVVFRRDKNWLELERLLRSEIGIGVKQRAGCLPYSEDQHGFRTLLAQTLSTAEASSWAVSTDSILAFTSNQRMSQLIKYFLEPVGSDRVETSEEQLMQWLASAAYEFTSQDKLPLIDPWITILSEMMKIELAPSCYLLWQMRLVYAETIGANNKGSTSLGLAHSHFVEVALNKWLKRNDHLLADYIQCRQVTGTEREQQALVGFLTFHGIPFQSQLQSLYDEEPKSMLDLYKRLKDYNIKPAAVKVIWQMLQYKEND
ncbi:anaphase-promoting complex subunit 1 [Halyomorpha halys]|uniref:anaphase-promoting complex subunit 1 n=1 Tax=Halyomorpha halys TaxID=286706 RepID=UPI0006D4F2B3|nr:anaphase-promoting complex subunit 1 [Halyomorpha halys]